MNTLTHDYLNAPATVDNPFEYRLKIKTFIDGSVDMIMTKVKHFIPKSPEHALGESTSYPRNDAEKKAENLIRAVRRAKEAVSHSVRQIQADHMLTLHTRENIQNRDEFFQYFTRFIRLVRTKNLINGELITRKENRFYPFCAVPEQQERGAFHMHIAVVGKQDIPLLRACWYVALGGSINDAGEVVKGQIDVTHQSKKWGGESEAWKAQKLVDYLSKYIGKSFLENEKLGLTRYTKSRNQEKVILKKQYLLACYSNGEKDHIDAMSEVIDIANDMGVVDFFVWGRWGGGYDVFTLKGSLNA